MFDACLISESMPTFSPFFIDYIFNKKNISKFKLSTRQFECLYYLARGMTMKQIARKMMLSPKTIEHYLAAIKNKMSCSTRYELIEKAISAGIFNNFKG